jgi:hypothetical protein
LAPGFGAVSVCREIVPTVMRSTTAYEAKAAEAACGIVMAGVAGHVK